MLKDANALGSPRARHVNSTTQNVPREILRDRVRNWRASREDRCGGVVAGLPTECELSGLAALYGWDIDADLAFLDYKPPPLTKNLSRAGRENRLAGRAEDQPDTR
ncbi:hypothetical protein ASPCAL09566 [Aspergillus calidoustus]|uniref:Uncharacterized protein n=1 Tax=Aspergillus calidoustus TaxID=454130 RepID=A0A0U5GV41_ASPCI|nr:hypothetical protein ASPCAL09566 [Aspergillus calidoustus]